MASSKTEGMVNGNARHSKNEGEIGSGRQLSFFSSMNDHKHESQASMENSGSIDNVTIQTSTGPMFTVRSNKQIYTHPITFKWDKTSSEQLKVRSKSLKIELFNKFRKSRDFETMFAGPNDVAYFDGRNMLYSITDPASRTQKQLDDIPLQYKNDNFKISIQTYVGFKPDLEGLRALLRLRNVKGPLDGNERDTLYVDDEILPTLDITKSGQFQLSVKAVPSLFAPSGNLLALFKRLRDSADAEYLLLSPSRLQRILVGLQVCKSQDPERNSCRIVGVEKSSNAEKMRVKIKSKLTFEWVPLEELDLLPGQKLPRKVDMRSRSRLRGTTSLDEISRNASAGTKYFQSTKPVLQDYFGLELEPLPLSAKLITAAPVPTYADFKPDPMENRNPFSVTGSASGHWSIARTNCCGFMKTKKQITPRFVLEIQKGRQCGRDRDHALKLALEDFSTSIRLHLAPEERANAPIDMAILRTGAVDFADFPERKDFRARTRLFQGQKKFEAMEDPVLVLLPDNNPRRFSNIKLWGDCVKGIKTVCTTRKNSSGSIMFPEQLSMKINHHAGGTNYTINDLNLDSKTCMVVGISVSHPSRSSNSALDECRSVAAVVGSTGEDFLRYPGSLRFQKRGVKEILELKDMMLECLENRKSDIKIRKVDGRLKEIIVYRTGISKEAYADLWQSELQIIEDAANASERDKVSVTLILVEKNHKTKFFRTPVPESYKPGFYRETDEAPVNHAKNGYNFYLQSHGVTQPKKWSLDTPVNFTLYDKTSANDLQLDYPKPVSSDEKEKLSIHPRNGYYSVLQYSAMFSKDELIRTTYKLCWNTVHSTSALSYVSPAYYANKLCERGLVYLKPVIDGQSTFDQLRTACFEMTDNRNPWHEDLDGEMFYI